MTKAELQAALDAVTQERDAAETRAADLEEQNKRLLKAPFSALKDTRRDLAAMKKRIETANKRLAAYGGAEV